MNIFGDLILKKLIEITLLGFGLLVLLFFVLAPSGQKYAMNLIKTDIKTESNPKSNPEEEQHKALLFFLGMRAYFLNLVNWE